MKPVKVLLVEDDVVDREAVRRAFKTNRIANEIVEAENGRDALDIMRGSAGAPLQRPYVVLLDINMPVMDGFEFLDELRADAELSDIVVFVLSTSGDQGDMFESYKRNVAGYMIKTIVGESFLEAIRLIEAYWRVVEMPDDSITRIR